MLMNSPLRTAVLFAFGSCWLPGCWAGSYDQGGDERAEQGFAAMARVVHELEEAEVVRQLLLRDAAVRAQPGAQQGPETLDGVDGHLAEAIAVLAASVFTLCVADCLVLIAPGWQAGVDAVLVRVDERALGNRGLACADSPRLAGGRRRRTRRGGRARPWYPWPR